MAEYYPLLAKAVAGRHDAPLAERQAIYDRARQALLGQLRSMHVPAEAIDRESASLDEAIARVENDVAMSVSTAPSLPPSELMPPAEAASPSTVPPIVVPPSTVLPRDPPPSVSRATSAPRLGPAVPARPRPAAEALSRIVAERPPGPPDVTGPREEREREASPEAPRPASPLPSAPTLQVPSFADILASTAPAEPDPDAAEAGAATAAGSDEPLRPPAPRPITRERFNPRVLILTVVGALVVVGIAYAAWRLRDKPDALARSRAAMLAAQQAEEQQTAKVSARADTPAAAAKASPAAAPVAAATQGAGAGAPPVPAAETPAQAEVPVQAETPVPASGPGTPAASDPAVPVTQRAAFLVDAPDDPQKVKTYVGTVIWSAGTSNPAQNQPIAQTVQATILVPEAALKLTMVLQKNFEVQFPASHTLAFDFTLDPGNTLGPVKQINAPQMRQDSAPAGDALIGLPVTITENHFLVGLSRGDATARNLDLIRSRNWFDVPVLLASGRVAKITFEKGADGQTIVNNVLQSWQ